MVVADHVQRVMKPNFAASWDEIGEENQIEETFALSSMKDIPGGYGVIMPPNRVIVAIRTCISLGNPCMHGDLVYMHVVICTPFCCCSLGISDHKQTVGTILE